MPFTWHRLNVRAVHNPVTACCYERRALFPLGPVSAFLVPYFAD